LVLTDESAENNCKKLLWKCLQ